MGLLTDNHRVMHGIEFSLVHMAGLCRGVWQTLPMDVIWAERNGNRRKIGFVGRHENARIVLLRHLKQDIREPFRLEIERLRLVSGGCSIDRSGISVLPDPRIVEAYVKGELHRKKSTLLMPAGIPSDK